MEKWSSKNCSSFCKNLALNLNPITSTVSWMVLEYNLPVFTPTSKLGFDKILNSVLRNELQRLNKQSTFLRWVSKQNLFCVNQKNRISSIFFLFVCFSILFLESTSAPTCIRFMASRIWSRWWAELRASSRISVNFNSFSLSSLFSCRIISASASVHSQILKKETNKISGLGKPDD